MRDDAKDYPTQFEDNTSHAHAVALLLDAGSSAGAGRREGVVLDLGCGNAPVAEPLARAGFDYVGLDLDDGSLAAVAERGFETHHVDLGADEDQLVAALQAILGDRPLAAILALDVLEHLVRPEAAVRAFQAVANDHEGAALVVSIPNVTHVDVAVRLLLGRWEMTPAGLLDDTHLRFFSSDAFDALFSPTRWRQVATRDTEAFHSDQFDLERSTAMQPGTPLRDLLWRVREGAGPHATTYQFVRRFELAPEGAARPLVATPGAPAGGTEPRPLVTLVVRVSERADFTGLPRLLADVAAQEDDDLELVVLIPETLGAAPAVAAAEAAGVELAHVVPVDAGVHNRNAAIELARGFYLCFVDGRDRLGPRYVAAVRRGAADTSRPDTTDPVVRLDAAAVELEDLVEGRGQSFELAARLLHPVEPDGFDLLRPGVIGRTALAAYAVPAAVCATVGLRFQEVHSEAAPTLFVARAAELCGLHGVGDLQVITDLAHARDGQLDFEALCHRLGETSYLFSPGGVARLADMRSRVSRATQRQAHLEDEVRDLERQLHDRRQELEDARRAAVVGDSRLGVRAWRAVARVRGTYIRLRALFS